MEPLRNVQAIFKERFWGLVQSKDEFVGSGLQDPTGRVGKYVGSELHRRLAWTAGPNMVIEGGWLCLIKGCYYSNLLKQGVADAPQRQKYRLCVLLNAALLLISVVRANL